MKKQELQEIKEDIPENHDLPNSIDILKDRRNQYKEQIMKMLPKLAELRQHPMFEWQKCIQDTEWIPTRKLLFFSIMYEAHLIPEHTRISRFTIILENYVPPSTTEPSFGQISESVWRGEPNGTPWGVSLEKKHLYK